MLRRLAQCDGIVSCEARSTSHHEKTSARKGTKAEELTRGGRFDWHFSMIISISKSICISEQAAVDILSPLRILF